MSNSDLLAIDKRHLWHPYTSMINPLKVYHVESASGVRIRLSSGKELIDGMSSWWSVIHGYNNSRLNKAATDQIAKMSHVMFGGLTHTPAISLAKNLLTLLPKGLERIFYSDSGSVAVEVALKMAIQYQHAKGNVGKYKIATIRGGYHGDTWHAMSVCDPDTGMHGLYNGRLGAQLFADKPSIGFYDKWDNSDMDSMREIFSTNADSMAAVILEPIVQGAGGMRFYHPQYLIQVSELCKEHDVLLIADEIATGFGRTGKMFAVQWSGITPDIMCIGKALTGGYMSFAATIATSEVADTISASAPHSFMHGPTFMGNPLAAAIATESLNIIIENSPLERIKEIEAILLKQLSALAELDNVSDVRVLGAIGVVEMTNDVDMEQMQEMFVEQGVWVRPFGRLVYIMPQYMISNEELAELTDAVCFVIKNNK